MVCTKKCTYVLRNSQERVIYLSTQVIIILFASMLQVHIKYNSAHLFFLQAIA